MSRDNAQARPVPPGNNGPEDEPPPAPTSPVSLYFPHAGRGQSVLVRFPGNRWIVIDANKAADGLPNATVELLRGPAEQTGFEILAVVLTHLHADHYSGLGDLFNFLAELSDRQGRALGDVVKALILPRSYDSFIEYVKRIHRPYLEAVLARLEILSKTNFPIGSLENYSFAWRSLGNGDLQFDESWLVTLYPPSRAVSRWLLGQIPDDRLTSTVKLGSSLVEVDNRFAYILGAGYGPGPLDLHVLLTSDIPGDAFSSLTQDLRQTVLPGIQGRKVGAPFPLGLLIRRGTWVSEKTGGPARLRPVQCLTVPHHGSGNGPAKAEDLAWWLDEPDQKPGRPAFAMVQGGPRALKANTLRELFEARLHVFATSKPLGLVDLSPGHTGCRALDSRIMTGALGPVPSVQPSWTEEFDFPPPPTAHLAVHGGTGGIHQVMARNIYKIVPYAPHWEHCEHDIVYDADGPTGR